MANFSSRDIASRSSSPDRPSSSNDDNAGSRNESGEFSNFARTDSESNNGTEQVDSDSSEESLYSMRRTPPRSEEERSGTSYSEENSANAGGDSYVPLSTCPAMTPPCSRMNIDQSDEDIYATILSLDEELSENFCHHERLLQQYATILEKRVGNLEDEKKTRSLLEKPTPTVLFNTEDKSLTENLLAIIKKNVSSSDVESCETACSISEDVRKSFCTMCDSLLKVANNSVFTLNPENIKDTLTVNVMSDTYNKIFCWDELFLKHFPEIFETRQKEIPNVLRNNMLEIKTLKDSMIREFQSLYVKMNEHYSSRFYNNSKEKLEFNAFQDDISRDLITGFHNMETLIHKLFEVNKSLKDKASLDKENTNTTKSQSKSKKELKRSKTISSFPRTLNKPFSRKDNVCTVSNLIHKSLVKNIGKEADKAVLIVHDTYITQSNIFDLLNQTNKTPLNEQDLKIEKLKLLEDTLETFHSKFLADATESPHTDITKNLQPLERSKTFLLPRSKSTQPLKRSQTFLLPRSNFNSSPLALASQNRTKSEEVSRPSQLHSESSVENSFPPTNLRPAHLPSLNSRPPYPLPRLVKSEDISTHFQAQPRLSEEHYSLPRGMQPPSLPQQGLNQAQSEKVSSSSQAQLRLSEKGYLLPRKAQPPLPQQGLNRAQSEKVSSPFQAQPRLSEKHYSLPRRAQPPLPQQELNRAQSEKVSNPFQAQLGLSDEGYLLPKKDEPPILLPQRQFNRSQSETFFSKSSQPKSKSSGDNDLFSQIFSRPKWLQKSNYSPPTGEEASPQKKEQKVFSKPSQPKSKSSGDNLPPTGEEASSQKKA